MKLHIKLLRLPQPVSHLRAWSFRVSNCGSWVNNQRFYIGRNFWFYSRHFAYCLHISKSIQRRFDLYLDVTK